MEVTRVVTKKRSEFGKPCRFFEQSAEVTFSVMNQSDNRFKNPKFCLSSAVQMGTSFSEHEVKTKIDLSLIFL